MKKSRLDEQNIANLYQDILNEDNVAGGDGVFGDIEGHGGDIENSDFYATGDSRYPWLIGTQTRNGEVKRKKKRKLDKKKRSA